MLTLTRSACIPHENYVMALVKMKWEALYDNLPTWCGYRYDQTNEGLLDMQYVHRITSNKNATYEQAISNESHRLNQIKEFFFP